MSAASNEVWVVMNSPYGGLSTTSSRITLIDDAQTLMTRGWMMATGASMGWVDDIKVEVVPEPVTLASLALGGVLLLLRRRR